MPFNKKIWSVNFALTTSGISGLALSILFYSIDFFDNRTLKKIITPTIWLGKNPLAVYVGSIFLYDLIVVIF
jgi:predicted acyltransferase